jgi:hypothetical protein
MDAHSLFQKPMKAWYAMKLNAFVASTSSTSVTKANGPHLLSELPRKIVRFDSSQTSAKMNHLPTVPNAKHSWIIQMLRRVYLLYCPRSQHGILENPSW